MAAFRRFDPYAALAEYQPQTLATLADLAGAASDSENRGEAPAIPDSNSADENQSRLGDAAKLAKPAKVAGPAAELRWGEAEEERAAIVKNNGGILRAWAEGFARLHPDHPPGDVPLRRWQRFIDDIAVFLDRWAAYAAALGWGPHDLFGCDRDRPFARVDQAGLLWVLNGNRIVALAENTATVETNTGARQIYRRRLSEHGRVLAWDLANGGCR